MPRSDRIWSVPVSIINQSANSNKSPSAKTNTTSAIPPPLSHPTVTPYCYQPPLSKKSSSSWYAWLDQLSYSSPSQTERERAAEQKVDYKKKLGNASAFPSLTAHSAYHIPIFNSSPLFPITYPSSLRKWIDWINNYFERRTPKLGKWIRERSE